MNYFKELNLKRIVLNALKEDIGTRDVTTEALIPKNKAVCAVILAKEDFIICGLAIAALAFRLQNKKVTFRALVKDGDYVKNGKVLAKIKGNAWAVLSAERVALNFLSLFSGIATKTREYVKIVKPYKTKILDTRKTTPGLRELQKYAVRIGGGYNHRFSLDEMVLVKDNHLKIINPKLQTLNTKQILSAKSKIRNLTFEIEVKNLSEFKAALKLKPDIVMLDNMNIKDIKKAVKIRNSLMPNTRHQTPKLEASGGITLNNIRQFAACGVDMISVGALTHSVDSVDISLEIQ